MPCLYVVTDFFPNMAVENMRFLGLDVAAHVDRGSLRFIDCYSGRAGLSSSSPYFVQNPENLTDLSIAIEEAKKGMDQACLVLDSITTLALEAGLDPTRRFVQTIVARVRHAGCQGLCSLDLGVLEESFVNFLRVQFDGVLEMKIEETESGKLSRHLRVFSMKTAKFTTTWIRLETVERGISISSP